MTVRGLRGATTATENTKAAIFEATAELLQTLVKENGIRVGSIASATFTATEDLNAAFPATAARVELGWNQVALMDLRQMSVSGDVPMCIRVLILLNTDASPADLRPVY
ncbi:MAG: chorismate mutase, partial [Chloroflexi bacterium]|nr:chorismate mutase [Chloroflexota bacterium]